MIEASAVPQQNCGLILPIRQGPARAKRCLFTMRSLLTWLGGGILLLTSLVPSSASQTLSGRYGPLALAVALDGSVYGVFAEQRVGNGTLDAPQFNCLFLLEGRMDGDAAFVTTWFPDEAERIRGTLRLGRDPSLQLDENPGGCLMTSGDMKDAPYGLIFDETHANWIGMGLVTRERAILYPEPVEATGRKRPYLVEFDPVAVVKRRPGWTRVEYLDGAAKPATGWVRDGDVALSAPPVP